MPSATRARENHASHDSGITILLVEDDADIRAIVALSLSLDSEMHLVEADRGSAALDFLQASPTPDVVLIDNSLPDMGGVELMMLIHQRHPATANRIAFLTASVRDEEIRNFEAAGAIAVIRKPFDPLNLSAVVRSLI